MRSEGNDAVVDCEDPMTVIACTTDTDACPAACREAADDDVIVKSGDLAVTANANSSRRVIKGKVSDLDTLKFKTSEEVTITKVTLERYGYSTYDSVKAVWLEDEDGNVIADEKEVNSKDVVTLSLKKDFRNVDGLLNAIVVVRMANDVADDPATDVDETFSVGSTIGFKVTDVSSTAKNVDLKDYTAYTYDIVEYAAGGLVINANPTLKKYDYEAGESYEIAKFKLAAGRAAVKLYGFTLDNRGDLSADEFIDSLTVTVNGEKVSGLKYNFNKDEQLVVSFDEESIAINKNATVVVSATFNEEFDEYGNTIAYVINKTTDVNAVEAKTDARVDVSGATNYTTQKYATDSDNWSFPAYQFNGSKVKISGTKLGNVDAAQGSEGVLIANGEISISEPIYKGTVKVTPTFLNDAQPAYVSKLTLVVNGDEYDSKFSPAEGEEAAYYYFPNVEIEDSGKVQLKIDIEDNGGEKGSINFSNLKFEGFQYEINKEAVTIKGNIEVSKVTIQPATASMENNLSKPVEFIKAEGTTKTVFEGTYTAKKGDVYLNKFIIVTKAADTFSTSDDRTFYVTIDGEPVGNTDDVYYKADFTKTDVNDNLALAVDFSNVLVKAGKSVTVKVEAYIDSSTTTPTAGGYDYILYVRGEDENENSPSGIGYDELQTIKVVEKGSVTIPTASSAKNTVLLKAKNQKVAEFVVKPSNNNDGVTLENLVLAAVRVGSKTSTDEETGEETTTPTETLISSDDIKVKVNGREYTDPTVIDDKAYDYFINEDLPTAGYTVIVTLNKEEVGEVALKVYGVNVDTEAADYVLPATAQKTFSAKYQSALVYLASQEDEKSFTSYTLAIKKYDDDYVVDNVKLYSDDACGTPIPGVTGLEGVVEDGDTFEIDNTGTTQTISCITYDVSGGDLESPEKVSISKKGYSAYFKVGENGNAWRVYAES